MVNLGLAAFIIYAIQTPGPVLALNESHLAQRTAHAVRVNHPGTLALADCYIMLMASGTISDLRFIG